MSSKVIPTIPFHLMLIMPSPVRPELVEGYEQYWKSMKSFYVYILKCADNSYYTGHTDFIEKRISEHMSGSGSGYTASRLPIEVVYIETFGSRYEALSAERRIKGWSRKKKEALIQKDWQKLVYLSNK